MRRWLPRVAVLVFVAVVIIWAATNREQLDPAAIDSWIRDLGILGPVVFALLYIAATVAFLPGLIFSLLGGALFGPVWGSLINLVAATLGASLAFVVARYLVQDWAAEKAGGRLRRMITGVESEAGPACAAVPVQPDQLRARPHPHSARHLYADVVYLHGARRRRFHMAGACRQRGAGG